MTLVDCAAPSPAIGAPIAFTAYLPPGYAGAAAGRARAYPTVYLLHGRGDDRTAWEQVGADLDELIDAGALPPVVAVLPDAPWSGRGSWYVDSRCTGADPEVAPGRAVETALTRDLVGHVDATFRTIADRAARVAGGYSMGGAGALRFALAHQDVFAAALVLSPAVYSPAPPAGSSTRVLGAFGDGPVVFDQARYERLGYPAALAAVDPGLPVELYIAAGDDDYAHPAPEDAPHDLVVECARLHAAARRTPGVSSHLRVLPGGHDWTVWRPAFREGLALLAHRLRTA